MNRKQILIWLTLILITLSTATATLSQVTTAPPKSDSATNFPTTASAASLDECSQLLNKTLEAYEKLKIAKAAADGELLTNKELRAKEEFYNAELLKAVALLVSSEKRDKSFFKKLIEQLGRILKAATRTEHLATIAGLIVILRNLK